MRDLTDGHARHLEFASQGNQLPSTLSKAIHATASIYAPAFSTPPLGHIPFNSVCNHAAVRVLTECLEDTANDAVWTRYPGILLWIVFTAYAAAEKMSERSFFATFAFRVGTSAAWWGPEAAGMAIRKFIEVKRMAEGFIEV